MSKHFKENTKDLAYYLTLYKLKGHTTWRTHLSQNPEGFAIEQKHWATQVNPPTVTEKKILRINRLTAEMDIKE